MRKQILVAVMLMFGVMSSAAVNRIAKIGTIYEEDFRNVGVKEADIEKARNVILDANKAHQILMLERQQLELEINKYMLEGVDENWQKISTVFDQVGDIEAELMKNKLKSQIEIKKYISGEQYQRARLEAVKRIEMAQVDRVEK